MEHRRSQRKSISAEIVLNCHNREPIRGLTSDIGSGGMFVETERIHLPVNTLVQLTVDLGSSASRRFLKASAMVAHAEPTGVGLMFVGFNSQFDGFLRNLASVSYNETYPARMAANH